MADNWEERPDVVRSALQWRMEQERRERAGATATGGRNGPKRQAKAGDPVEPLPVVPAAVMAGKAKPREFLDSAQMLPMRAVTLMSGDGGVGKSLLALQLAVAAATGTEWLGFEVQPGSVVYFAAEDDQDEIERRLNAIAEAEEIDLAEVFTLYTIPMLGEDAALAFEKDGRLAASPLYRRLDATLERDQPILLILDTLALIYAANENNRLMAQQFLSMLARLCLKHDCTILLLAHPSLAGMASGSGLSGTTGWNNGVRSRLYLFHAEEGEEGEVRVAGDRGRVLESKKANYAPSGQRHELTWKNGRFVRYQPESVFQRIAVEDMYAVRHAFSDGKWRADERASGWGGYAVAEVLQWDVGRGLPAKERGKEQERNRKAIRQLLNRWLMEKVIAIIDGQDHRRHPVQFYTKGEMGE